MHHPDDGCDGEGNKKGGRIMARYIDAEKLAEHKFLGITYDRYVTDGRRKSEEEIYAYKVGYNEAIANIEQFAPTADVRENVHAHWDKVEVKTGEWWHTCSKCKATWGSEDGDLDFKFCPLCGAEMEET
jgi:hypothetical protein